MPISSDEDYKLSSASDSATGNQPQPQVPSIAESKLLETVEEELKTIQSRQNLQAQVDAKIEQSNLGRSTPALKGQTNSESDSSRSNSVSPMRRQDTVLHPKQRKSMTSDSEAMFSSDTESAVEIHKAYYAEFVSREDFTEEVDELKEEMRKEILQEAREILLAETDEMIREQVEDA